VLKTTGEQVFRPGGILSGQVFTLEDQLLTYRNAYGKLATVPRSAIETPTVDAKGRGTSTLRIIGHGTALASIDLPRPWAVATQRWLMEQLGL
jgi:hypothetical protein